MRVVAGVAAVLVAIVIGGCGSDDGASDTRGSAQPTGEFEAATASGPEATLYEVGQLQVWYDEVRGDLIVIPGVIYTDVQEGGPWIEIGVDSEEAADEVRRVFASHGVPETAYRLPIGDPGQDD